MGGHKINIKGQLLANATLHNVSNLSDFTLVLMFPFCLLVVLLPLFSIVCSTLIIPTCLGYPPIFSLCFSSCPFVFVPIWDSSKYLYVVGVGRYRGVTYFLSLSPILFQLYIGSHVDFLALVTRYVH